MPIIVSSHITASGHITGSVTSTGSFGRLIASTFSGDGSGLSSVTAGSVTWANISSKPTVVSASAQIKDEISGSFTDVSSSFSTRIKANEDIVKGKTILSQSAQIKDEISGSFTSASSSLAGRISTVEGTGTTQGVGQSDNVTFNKITTTGPDVLGGNVTIGGNLTLIGSQSSATKLTVTDQFGFFASGSEADNLDAGIMVQSGSSANTGSVLYHDVHPVANVNPQGGRWAVAKEFKVDSVTVTPLEYVVTVKSSGDTDDPDSTDVNYGVGEMYINNDGEIFIYTGN